MALLRPNRLNQRIRPSRGDVRHVQTWRNRGRKGRLRWQCHAVTQKRSPPAIRKGRLAMESTLGSSTVSTFRGVMSWLALCPRIVSEEWSERAKPRTIQRTAVGGPPLQRGLATSEGITASGGFVERHPFQKEKGGAAARRVSTLRAERDRDKGCSRIGEVGDQVGRRAIVGRCPRAIRCQSTMHGGPGLARRGRLVPTSRSNHGLRTRRLARGPRGLGCAHGRARGWTRLQESVSDVRVARPEVMSLGLVRKGSRATLVGRMREHRRRNRASVQRVAKAARWSAARAAAHRGKASAPHGARRFDERRVQEGRGVGRKLPHPFGDGWRCGLERACAERGSRGLEGEVAGSQGGQRFLGWITSRSTTPCLMRRTGRSARSGARSGSQSWNRGVNRDPPGWKPALFGGSLEGGRSSLHARKCGEARLG
jgi:hypothetical protein